MIHRVQAALPSFDQGHRFCSALVFGLTWAVLLVGCGKAPKQAEVPPPEATSELRVSEGAPTAPELTQSPEPVAAEVPGAPPAIQAKRVVIPPGADIDATLTEMNRALRRWIVRTQRRPSNYDEFATSAKLDAPPPPAGKKYELTKNMRIVLVDL